MRVVLDERLKTAVIHMPYDVRIPVQPAVGDPVGLDMGVTEVLASSNGEKYGAAGGLV